MILKNKDFSESGGEHTCYYTYSLNWSIQSLCIILNLNNSH